MDAHPVASGSERALFDLAAEPLDRRCARLEDQCRGHEISHTLVQVYDAGVLVRSADRATLLRLRGERWSFSLLAGLESPESARLFVDARQHGFVSITFHPYLQRLGREKIETAVALAREAERQGLFINICSACGTKDLYRYDNLDLAVHLAEAVTCPIVLLHGGGARVLEAMLIAEALPHVYLETSFSLPYWEGSSVEGDIAFAMRKLGTRRWMFGSDAPFLTVADALAAHRRFFERHRFSDKEIEDVMHGTARGLLKLS